MYFLVSFSMLTPPGTPVTTIESNHAMNQIINLNPFGDLQQLPLIFLSAGAMWVLLRGADLLVEGAASFAYRMGMPKVIVGATIVSLGTTSPEAAVSVMAAWSGDAGLALGNAVGSIIADTGLIFGLGCAIVILPADRFVLTRQGWVKISTDVLLAAICYGVWLMMGDDAALGRWVGVLMVALLVAYMAISVKWSKLHPAAPAPIVTGEPGVPAQDESAVEEVLGEDAEIRADAPIWLTLTMLIVGLFLVVGSSHFLIATVKVLAEKHWGVPDVVIAGTLIAFGTSLPELAVGMTSIAKGHTALLVGNVIGADILNVLFVIGASAIAKELPIIDLGGDQPMIFLWLHLPVMIMMTGLFLFYIFRAVRRGRFSRWMGYPLLILYVGYVVVGLMTSAG